MKRTLGILGLFILCAIGAQVAVEGAKAAFWQWSTSSTSNGNSDPTISWVEGMPPSVVNDSGRAMMARLAEQAADTSGQLTTAGGPVAFTVSSNQGFPNPPQNGQVIGVMFNVNSGASPTLSVDGGAAIPIDASIGTPASVGPGAPTSLVYNAANSIWLIRGGGGGGTPLGSVVAYTGTTAPAGYVFADGSCLSTTTFATYWVLIGSPAPGACGAGQFKIIDLRGYVLAGLDTMPGGSPAGRLTSAATGCGTAMTVVGAACATHESHIMTVAELAIHDHYAPITDPTHTHPVGGQIAYISGVSGYGVGNGGVLGQYYNSAITVSAAATGVYVNGAAANYTSNTGSSTPMPAMGPTIGVIYIIRVL
jgi:hypothetical protein